MLITTAEAAERLGLSQRWLRKMCADGRIEAQLVSHVYLINPASLDAFEKEERKRGRPAQPAEAGKGEHNVQG